MRSHEAELKHLATEITALLDDAATACAALDSAIECQTRVCAAASSKFLQLEFRIRALEGQMSEPELMNSILSRASTT